MSHVILIATEGAEGIQTVTCAKILFVVFVLILHLFVLLVYQMQH